MTTDSHSGKDGVPADRRLRTVLLRLPAAAEAGRLRSAHATALRLALEMNADPFGKHDVLVLTDSGGAELRIRVAELPVTLGRGAEADYEISGASVSRVHARLERIGPFVRLVDTGSANGTRVNGERVADRHLRFGDEIALGDALLTVSRS